MNYQTFSDTEDSEIEDVQAQAHVGDLLGVGRPRMAPIPLGGGADDILDTAPVSGPSLSQAEGIYIFHFVFYILLRNLT